MCCPDSVLSPIDHTATIRDARAWRGGTSLPVYRIVAAGAALSWLLIRSPDRTMEKLHLPVLLRDELAQF